MKVTTQATVLGKNQHPGRCGLCSGWVPYLQGVLLRGLRTGRFFVRCRRCHDRVTAEGGK
jgi:hypothetical protein